MNDGDSPGWQRPELTYCSNVHSATTFASVLEDVIPCLAGVKSMRQLPSMGTGLWLADGAATDLVSDPSRLDTFRNHLRNERIELFTLNGFPYGPFHQDEVKTLVYFPNWSEESRVRYSLNLARILAACLPAHISTGTVSTLPLGLKRGWTTEAHRRSLDHLCRLAQEFGQLEEETGREIVLCLEMEPGCVLETSREAIEFFVQDLARHADELGVDVDLVRKHIGICFDVCHQAVMFEDLYRELGNFVDAGIRIGKIQVSSALELANPAATRGLEALRRFDEIRYLHQVRTLSADGDLKGVPDLRDALDDEAFPRDNAWRVHFHVPVQSNDIPAFGLGTTQSAIGRVFDYCRDHREFRPHLEVETYTWDVLPDELRPRSRDDLLAGLTAELQWVEAELSTRGLLEH